MFIIQRFWSSNLIINEYLTVARLLINSCLSLGKQVKAHMKGSSVKVQKEFLSVMANFRRLSLSASSLLPAPGNQLILSAQTPQEEAAWMSSIVCLQIQVLTASTSKCDLIWK